MVHLLIRFYTQEIYFIKKDSHTRQILEHWYFKTGTENRKNAMGRFLKDYTIFTDFPFFGTIASEIEESDLEKFKTISDLDERSKFVNTALKDFGNHIITLDEAYDRLLPYILSSQLAKR